MSTERKRKYQKRGRERRNHIIRTALEMLKTEDLEKLSLADVSARAEVPLSSLYHFFPDVQSLWAALIPVYYAAMLEHWRKNVSVEEIKTWQELLDRMLRLSAAFYVKYPEYQQLILGGKTPAHFRHSQTVKGDVTVRVIQRVMAEQLELPHFEGQTRVYTNAFQIAEHFYTLSVIRHGRVLEETIVESQRAVRAYLSLYLPTFPDGPGQTTAVDTTNKPPDESEAGVSEES